MAADADVTKVPSGEPPSSSDRDVPGVPCPPPLFFVAGLLAGLGLELAFPIERPPTAVAVGGAVAGVVLWAALDGLAMVAFARAKTSPIPFKPATALVTGGPYAVTRNPMYVGMAALYVAIALVAGLIWALILLPAVILAVDRLVIAREEPYLARRFGEAYRDYSARVRRWL